MKHALGRAHDRIPDFELPARRRRALQARAIARPERLLASARPVMLFERGGERRLFLRQRAQQGENFLLARFGAVGEMLQPGWRGKHVSQCVNGVSEIGTARFDGRCMIDDRVSGIAYCDFDFIH